MTLFGGLVAGAAAVAVAPGTDSEGAGGGGAPPTDVLLTGWRHRRVAWRAVVCAPRASLLSSASSTQRRDSERGRHGHDGRPRGVLVVRIAAVVEFGRREDAEVAPDVSFDVLGELRHVRMDDVRLRYYLFAPGRSVGFEVR